LAQATNNSSKRSIGDWLTASFLLTLALCPQVFAAPLSYTYDDLNRLTEANYNNGQQVITYTYDAAGNILSKTIVVDTDKDGTPDTEDTDDDGDGIPDTYEKQYAFLNPLDASDASVDQDDDGLTNLQEYQAGSDPTKEDTDRDGLSDKYEWDNNLDPTDGICPDWVCGGGFRGWRLAIPQINNVAVYTLTVSVIGTGNVTSAPAGINCDVDCVEDYSDGTQVTLTATSAADYTFTGWSGDCAGTGTCTITMNQAHSETATFELDTDGDGIPNSQDPDDDNDGLLDSYENQYAFLDPLDASDASQDRDSDGLTNLQEYQAGSDPTKEDTDRDGLSDKYELDNDLDPMDGICPDWVCGGLGSWRYAIPIID